MRATLWRLDQWVVANIEPPLSRLMPLQPSKGDPKVLQAPKGLPDAVVQVPQRDPDGNPLGGIRLPDIAVPLGVHGVQNDPLSFSCSLVGASVPFGKDKLASLYKDQNDYVNRVRVAARDAMAEGFLLPDDVAVIVNSAAETPVFAPPPAEGPPR
jgi:hypothetical protein